jgi:hypothetical protein
MGKQLPRLGKLPPQHDFFLNPYRDARFTRCPKCDRKMGQRKLPLFIHVDDADPVVINFTCRYCSNCDLLIAHKDRLEDVLVRIFTRTGRTDVIGNPYMVVGSLDRSAWQEGDMAVGHALDHLHDFRKVLIFEPAHYGWVKDKRKDRR